MPLPVQSIYWGYRSYTAL